MAAKFRLALIQLAISGDKATNLARAAQKVGEAAKNGAKLVVLPECFNSPFGHEYFKTYAESASNGPTVAALGKAARDNRVYLIGGTFPETDGGRLFNCCTFFNPKGELAGKFRKLHLFDIDVPGKMTFKESDTMSPGQKPVIFNTELCKIGLGICYDIRFGELSQMYVSEGCNMLIFPSAFNMTTGPMHWELLARSRSVDYQSYVALCSFARDSNASYVAYGHSLVADPWGNVIASADEKEATVYADIDMNIVKEVRQMIPTSIQRRTDVYGLVTRVKPEICQ